MKFSRQFDISRASVNVDTGEFRGVLATDGEASDGHILSMEGGHIPDRMPLFVNHRDDPRTQLGSLFPDGKTAHQIKVRGQVMLEGVGAERDVRHDLVAKMAAGHVGAMSIRWDANDEDVVYRTDLPEDNPYYVSEKKAKADFRYRYGRFFKRWHALEGSVVGLGADPGAVMRFAGDPNASEAVRSFWQRAAIDQMVVPQEQISTMLLQLRGDIRNELADVLVPYVERIATLEKFLVDFDSISRAGGMRPDPNDYDSKDKFMSACIPIVMKEGKTQEQAVGKCNGMWENRIRTSDSTSDEDEGTRAERERAETGDNAEAQSKGDEQGREISQEQVTEQPKGTKRQKRRWDPEEIARAISVAIERRDAAMQEEIDALVRRAQGRV